MKTQRATTRFIIVAFIVTIFLITINISRADAQSVLPCKQYHAALRKHGLPVKVFAPIMWRESRCIPRAIGWNYKKGTDEDNCKLAPARQYRRCKAIRSFDLGLLQINSSWVTVTKTICKTDDIFKLLQTDCNLKVAAHLYADGKGITNWRATSNASISTGKP